ncbi:MAG: YidC/Oxa1 family membrane protein insertase [Patescibacteria group bacterium]
MWGLIKIAYGEIFYKPLLNGLLALTSVLPFNDLGFAVILLTILVRLILFPFTHKTLKTQQVMKRIEPDVKRIQGGGKSREEQAKELMELYRSHGINPLSGFLALFLQLPVLIALYHVFWKGLPFKISEVYGFLSVPETINTMFLGFISLTEANVGMALLAAVSQFWQAKLAIPPAQQDRSSQGVGASNTNMASMMQKQMLFVFPVLIFFIAYKLPAAVSLYWTSMNIFAIVHEAYVRHKSRTI